MKMGVSKDTSHQYRPDAVGSKLSMVIEFSVASDICNKKIHQLVGTTIVINWNQIEKIYLSTLNMGASQCQCQCL